MWEKNNSQSQSNRSAYQSPSPRQNSRNFGSQDRKRHDQNEKHDRARDYSQNYSQNYVQDGRNPFNSDLGSERGGSTGGSASHFNSGESRDDSRSQYSSNSNPTFGRTERNQGSDDPAEGSRWSSDYSSRSGSSVSNRQGQTGGSAFTSQYGLNYAGSPDAGSTFGTDYGMAYGDRNQNWGERSDYGSEHANLDSANDKDRWSLAGLNTQGLHLGKGPNGYRRSDERIQEEASEHLTHDSHIDASEIEVSVSEGVITLSGTVENRRMKRLAENCVETLSGVTDVKNEIRVQLKMDSNNHKDNPSASKLSGKSNAIPKSLM